VKLSRLEPDRELIDGALEAWPESTSSAVHEVEARSRTAHASPAAIDAARALLGAVRS
jgi:hypothetical protein